MFSQLWIQWEIRNLRGGHEKGARSVKQSLWRWSASSTLFSHIPRKARGCWGTEIRADIQRQLGQGRHGRMGPQLGLSGRGHLPCLPRTWEVGSGRQRPSLVPLAGMGGNGGWESRGPQAELQGGGPSKGGQVEPYNSGAVLPVSVSAPTSLQSELRQVASAHTPQIERGTNRILWPPDAESRLFGKDPDAGKDWGQEEKGTTEDEMIGWHHWHNGLESEQTPGDSKGQGSLACYSPWCQKEPYHFMCQEEIRQNPHLQGAHIL